MTKTHYIRVTQNGTHLNLKGIKQGHESFNDAIMYAVEHNRHHFNCGLEKEWTPATYVDNGKVFQNENRTATYTIFEVENALPEYDPVNEGDKILVNNHRHDAYLKTLTVVSTSGTARELTCTASDSDGAVYELREQDFSLCPKIGMGFTYNSGSDRYASTIVSVTKSGKTIEVVTDDYLGIGTGDYYGSQTYVYTNRGGTGTRKFKLTKEGYWRLSNSKWCGGNVGHRNHYSDPSF
jgi:hypothetical protein